MMSRFKKSRSAGRKGEVSPLALVGSLALFATRTGCGIEQSRECEKKQLIKSDFCQCVGPNNRFASLEIIKTLVSGRLTIGFHQRTKLQSSKYCFTWSSWPRPAPPRPAPPRYLTNGRPPREVWVVSGGGGARRGSCNLLPKR